MASGGASMTPEAELLENHENFVSTHCTKNCAASVDTAR